MHGRIALVTTDRASRSLVPLILAHAGHKVDVFGPVEALGFLCENAADALILDLGPDQAASFVRLGCHCNWQGPTIVLSADSRTDLEAAAVEADAFVQKPFDPRELVAAVEHLMTVAAI
jgi:DNA-binding response OmpR family regulator